MKKMHAYLSHQNEKNIKLYTESSALQICLCRYIRPGHTLQPKCKRKKFNLHLILMAWFYFSSIANDVLLTYPQLSNRNGPLKEQEEEIILINKQTNKPAKRGKPWKLVYIFRTSHSTCQEKWSQSQENKNLKKEFNKDFQRTVRRDKSNIMTPIKKLSRERDMQK